MPSLFSQANPVFKGRQTNFLVSLMIDGPRQEANGGNPSTGGKGGGCLMPILLTIAGIIAVLALWTILGYLCFNHDICLSQA